MVGDILQPTHLLFVLVVALLVLGPKRLPEVGRALGRGLRDFRGAMNGEDRSEPTISPTAEASPTTTMSPATTVVQDSTPSQTSTVQPVQTQEPSISFDGEETPATTEPAEAVQAAAPSVSATDARS